MCVNTRYVYNNYIRKSILVDCGKCPSCLQKKAASRASRIRNNVRDGEICLFLTLTYKNEFVPYVRLIDIKNQMDYLNVYRDCSIRRKRVGSNYDTKFVVDSFTQVLDTYWVHGLWATQTNKLAPQLNKKAGCVGVCYYKDLQDFLKRLRQNLIRHYNCYDKFTTFSCSEYGSYSYRPHFHVLMFIPKFSESIFRSAIVESWPFADRYRTEKFIEVARDCASYVASYVNSGSCLSSVLAFSMFKQKHSYSKSFGLGVDCFNLNTLLEKIKSGDLRYYSKAIRDGQTTIAGFPVPKYVINRFFPRFKGFSRLSPSEVRDVVLHPEILCPSDMSKSFYHSVDSVVDRLNFWKKSELDYSPKDTYAIKVRLDNAYNFYHKVTGFDRLQYAIHFVEIWILYKSVVLRDSLVNDIGSVTDWLAHYENINDLNFDIVSAPTLTALFDKSCFEENPNKLTFRIKQENQLVSLYYKMCKQKKVTNQVMADLGLNV